MLEAITVKLGNQNALAGVIASLSIVATMVTIGFSLIENGGFAKRVKSVSNERERMRQRERAKNVAPKGLRQESNAYMRDIVERYSLATWLNTENVKDRLACAGYRGPQAEIAFLFFRAASPIVFLLCALLYFNLLGDPETDLVTEIGISVAVLYAGVKAPEVFLRNATVKRQQAMRRAFPDALDLMLICVESGMSIEMAFRKVGQEIGVQSTALAEEFALATAELNYLPDRRSAYNNLATRTGLPAVKQVATVLVQAEKYGTPLGQALRVTAQESRDARMIEAERIAASLPPKLTVPMIVFFLPVLMLVVMAPAGIQIFLTN